MLRGPAGIVLLPRRKSFFEGNFTGRGKAADSFHYREKLQSKKSYLKILPQLKKIRIGWTSAEVRLALGGSIYRIPNGYTYFQEGLLWNDGFVRNNSGPLSVVIMPFGYRDEKGRPHKKVVVRAEGGLVTAVFWQLDIYKKKK